MSHTFLFAIYLEVASGAVRNSRLVLRAGLKAMQFVSGPRPKENTIASVVRTPPSRQASFRVQRTQINGGAGPHYVFQTQTGERVAPCKWYAYAPESYIPLQQFWEPADAHWPPFQVRVLSDSGLVAKAKTQRGLMERLYAQHISATTLFVEHFGCIEK
ncbi:Hypothetical_protein [Hexamita inflata]|uniref:Hypothetical_protein n=1 Tax=Hexamita inflata TaxID=28002 RepID=A0AA86NLQ6_9EUKA|nr:Hypothetical protein HINF_LOCUS9050 [Hexamita inflata]